MYTKDECHHFKQISDRQAIMVTVIESEVSRYLSTYRIWTVHLDLMHDDTTEATEQEFDQAFHKALQGLDPYKPKIKE